MVVLMMPKQTRGNKQTKNWWTQFQDTDKIMTYIIISPFYKSSDENQHFFYNTICRGSMLYHHM